VPVRYLFRTRKLGSGSEYRRILLHWQARTAVRGLMAPVPLCKPLDISNGGLEIGIPPAEPEWAGIGPAALCFTDLRIYGLLIR
jgi:hypothetical protein